MIPNIEIYFLIFFYLDSTIHSKYEDICKLTSDSAISYSTHGTQWDPEQEKDDVKYACGKFNFVFMTYLFTSILLNDKSDHQQTYNYNYEI